MIINFIKFIHVLCALSLLGLTGYCVTRIGDSYDNKKLNHLNKNLLIISVIALLTGTLLVYPKHFTFHTLWIQTAYLLLITYCLIIMIFKEKITKPWTGRSLYTLLMIILILITHDAVTKNTVLSFFTP